MTIQKKHVTTNRWRNTTKFNKEAWLTFLYRYFSKKKVIKMLLSWKGIPRDFRNYLFLLLYIYLVIDTTVVGFVCHVYFVIILLFFQLCAYLRYGAVLKVLSTCFNTFKIKCTNDTQMITECYSPKQTNMGIFQFQGMQHLPIAKVCSTAYSKQQSHYYFSKQNL